MNMEAQTYVAWCPHHGIPLHEAYSADGWNWCTECDKLYRVIIKAGRYGSEMPAIELIRFLYLTNRRIVI